MKKTFEKKRDTKEVIKQISNFILKTQVKQILIKHKLSKIPNSKARDILEKDYVQLTKDFDETVFEFSMLKYLYLNLERSEVKAKRKTSIPRGK